MNKNSIVYAPVNMNNFVDSGQFDPPYIFNNYAKVASLM